MKINDYLKEEFVKSGLISKEEGLDYLSKANNEDRLLHDYLINALKFNKDTVLTLVGKIFNIPYYEGFNIYNLDNGLASSFNKMFIIQKRIVPFKKDDNNEYIIVLIDNPFSLDEVSKIRYYTALKYKVYLIDSKDMDSLIFTIDNKSKREEAADKFKKEEGYTDEDEKVERLEDFVDGPSVQLADTLLKEALNEKASDIHIEPMEDKVRVRFRVDGVLKEHATIDAKNYQSLISRYKIMSRLDIAERRVPQDGKINFNYNGIEYDFRVSTLPIQYGEKIVIRLYNSLDSGESLENIIHDKEDYNDINELISSPHGIILLTGPTGSGKTTTLYSVLKRLNNVGVNIITVEDPVENDINGINQLQVNNKVDLTFARSLRSILRQDPNIIMVGEIRDSETAHIAVQAAITGHLVLSSVHTNDALTTITRLIDMGVEPYLVSDALLGAISQRLVRRLCPKCKKEHIVTHEESMFLDDVKEGDIIYEARGCESCNYSGYNGRIAVFEILKMNDVLRRAVANSYEDIEKIRSLAHENNFKEINVKASKLVKEGLISLDEYKSIINVVEVMENKKRHHEHAKTTTSSNEKYIN